LITEVQGQLIESQEEVKILKQLAKYESAQQLEPNQSSLAERWNEGIGKRKSNELSQLPVADKKLKSTSNE
jgi:hypothetical protein